MDEGQLEIPLLFYWDSSDRILALRITMQVHVYLIHLTTSSPRPGNCRIISMARYSASVRIQILLHTSLVP